MTEPPAAFAAREKAAYTVMNGNKLFIFGGLDAGGKALGDGAIYDKTTDSWSILPTAMSAPSPRQLATAAWSGSRVYVVGGSDANTTLGYNDAFCHDSDGWYSGGIMTTARVAPYAAIATDQILIWGGKTATGTPLNTGERSSYGATYVPSTWTATMAYYGAVTPEKVSECAWATSSSGALVYGGKVNGSTKTNKAYAYSFVTGSWTQLSNGPSARWGAFATSDGNAYYIWGGRDDDAARSDGYRYYNSWTSLGSSGAPSARWAPHRRTGWAFALNSENIVVIGGLDNLGNPLTDGGRYNSSTNTWSEISSWPSQEAHDYGIAVALDGEIFVWGGRNGATVTATGERYLP